MTTPVVSSLASCLHVLHMSWLKQRVGQDERFESGSVRFKLLIHGHRSQHASQQTNGHLQILIGGGENQDGVLVEGQPVV